MAGAARLTFLLASAGALAGPTALGAQRVRDRFRMVDTGAVVRVGVTSQLGRGPLVAADRHVQGTVLGIAPDTLYLRPSDSARVVAIPRFQIRGVQMRLGPPSRRGSALRRGAAFALIGAIVRPFPPPFRSTWRGVAAGAGLGFGVGAVAGLAQPSERWRVAWIPECRRPALAARPSGEGRPAG
jgi:hypothetical protein